jgi:Tol biopolymer transport system component
MSRIILFFLLNLFLQTNLYSQGEHYPILNPDNKTKIVNLGPDVNSPAWDYAPAITMDGKKVFFVSNREGSKLEITLTGEKRNDPSHDFWAFDVLSENNFSKPYNIDTTGGLGHNTNITSINSSAHEGAGSIAPDGTGMYLTACGRTDGFGSCDIYTSFFDAGSWSLPSNVGNNINTEAFDTQPSVSPDGKTLFFVSTRKGPHSDGKPIENNMDIWFSNWDNDNFEWGPAKNIEDINTKRREFTPFICPDGKTLIFASSGYRRKSEGGLDFYVTEYDEENDKWSKPRNLGSIINTRADEMFITMPESGDVLYFSSEREDIDGYQGELDLYMMYIEK